MALGIGQGLTSSGQWLAQTSFQMGAHAILGGYMNVFQGGEFGAGALSGAFGSVFGGTTNSLLKNAGGFLRVAGTTFSGAMSGGFGSVMAGGNFWDGVRQGLISGGLNHGVHAGWFGPNMAAAITQKIRHLWGPGALQLSGSITSAFGIGTKMEKGEVFMLRGKDAIALNGIDGLLV